MTTTQLKRLMEFLNDLTDTELYEAGKLVTHLTGVRHATRVLQGAEVRPGKRGVRWKTVKKQRNEG